MKKAIAFFDFDGTITSKDSFLDFLLFVHGKKKVATGFLRNLPWFIGYKAKLIANDAAKLKVLNHFFRGWAEEAFRKTAAEYSQKRLPEILRPAAMERIAAHREAGEGVVIVSASIRCWLEPWCELNGLELLATEVAFEKGRWAARYATPNCHGEEKVRRIRAAFDLTGFDAVYAYGDTGGDRPMLKLAGEKGFYKPFHESR